jgi:hypothetical protein
MTQKFPHKHIFILKDIHDKFTTEKNRGAVKRHLPTAAHKSRIV